MIRRRDRYPGERMSWPKRILVLIGIGVLTGVVILVAGFGYLWNTLELPPEEPLAQTTFLTDANDQPLASFNAGENRTPVELEEIPLTLRDAVLATEDRNFYSHKGVDPRGIARALWVDINHGQTSQGGSTLSQQYVKTIYVGTDRTVWRKLKEAVLAVKLEQRESKDEILNNYLNAIYFGRGAYGVQEASQAYFDKDVKDLDLKESAYLAGLIRAPELADVTKAPDVAKQRRDTTLDSMVATGVITPQQRDEAVDTPLTTYVTPKATRTPTAISGSDKGTQYFVEYVKQTLVQKYGEQRVESGGLRVKTTIDLNMQAKAYDSVYGYLKPNEPSAALVTIDQTGAIKAMLGGRDFATSQVNLAVGRDGGGTGRQAGSTFKPFTLAAAIEDGVCRKQAYRGPATLTLPDADGGRPWKVSNFGNQGFGTIDLLTATANSVNTVYAQLNEDIGPSLTADMAKKAGIKSPVGNNVANVLGTASVSPLEMADAYMTFGLNGLRVDATPILEVKTPNGEVLEKIKTTKTRVMAENTAESVNLALQQVVQRGSGTKAQIGRPLAGKTGTTEDNGDAWFVGYTPNMSTAIWMGYPEGASRQMNNVRGIPVTGGSYPAIMFGNYMRQVVDRDSGNFTNPPDCRIARNNGNKNYTEDQESPTTTTSTTEVPEIQDRRGLLDFPGRGQDEERANRDDPQRRVTVPARPGQQGQPQLESPSGEEDG